MREQMGIEIVFYDVETTVPFEQGQKFEVLEFAAVVVTVPAMAESSCFSTLIRPSSDLMITSRSIACNGITKEALAQAPTFSQVADSIYSMLHGRVWAGHNIVRFDNLRLKEAFSGIGKPAPEAAGFIDTLPLLREKFGVRAGNMKMATLASFFGLGDQEHRSLADVRMNLEVLKRCATLLFLESYFPKLFSDALPAFVSLDSEETIASSVLTSAHRSATSTKSAICCVKEASHNTPNSGLTVKTLAEAREETRFSLVEEDIAGSSGTILELCSKLNNVQLRQPNSCFPYENDLHDAQSHRVLSVSSISVGNIGNLTAGDLDEPFLELKDVLPASLTAQVQPSSWGGWKVVLLHGGLPLRIFDQRMRVKFSLSDKYSFDSAGNPTFAIAAELSSEASRILHICDAIVKKVAEKEGCLSWRPSIQKREGGAEFIRIRIRTMGSGADAKYSTRFYVKDSTTGSLLEKSLGSVDVAAFQNFIHPGCVLDMAFSCDAYNFNGCTGLKFVAYSIIL